MFSMGFPFDHVGEWKTSLDHYKLSLVHVVKWKKYRYINGLEPHLTTLESLTGTGQVVHASGKVIRSISQ